MITEYILSQCPELTAVPEYGTTDGLFTMINSGGVETEVGEWLYSFVRMVKPKSILETGTFYGLSAAYMGLALKKNKRGKIVTLDICTHENKAIPMWATLGISDVVEFKNLASLDYSHDSPIDILFLDSEPCFRFSEFVRFYDSVVPGGFILIHDLHPHLSYSPSTVIDGMVCWPYGDFRKTLGPFIKEHKVQVISFPTPRGFTVFQKERSDFSATRHLRNEI